MLRISMRNDTPVATLKIEGRLVGPWAKELENTWKDLWASATHKAWRLDLRGVSYVDSNGARILREIVKATAAEIFADSPLTEYFANQARRDPAPESIKEDQDAVLKCTHSNDTM